MSDVSALPSALTEGNVTRRHAAPYTRCVDSEILAAHGPKTIIAEVALGGSKQEPRTLARAPSAETIQLPLSGQASAHTR